MKSLFFSLLLVPVIAVSQPVRVNKPVVCEDLDKIVTFLQDQSKETVHWLGPAPKSTIALTINKDTKEWTLIEFNVKENIGCIIGAGTNYTVPQPAPQSDRPSKKF